MCRINVEETCKNATTLNAVMIHQAAVAHGVASMRVAFPTEGSTFCHGSMTNAHYHYFSSPTEVSLLSTG